MESIENIIKKLVYTGVGIIAVTREKFEKAIDDLVKNDKLSVEEGKKIMEDFIKSAEAKREEFESQTKILIDKAMSKINFATKHDLEELTRRIEELEAFLAAKDAKKEEQKTE